LSSQIPPAGSASGSIIVIAGDSERSQAGALYRNMPEQQRAEQGDQPQPTRPDCAPGSMEWLAAKDKSS
jgi:hypothetical protein